MKTYLLLIPFMIIFLSNCSGGSNDVKKPSPAIDDSKIGYSNPVIGTSVPDPTVIRTNDKYYYLYSTEDIHNLPIFKSKDLVNWEQVGTAFTDKTRPDFLDGNIDNTDNVHASIWAPEIRYIKNKYVLFYSLAQWGNHWVSTIGYSVSDSPEGPFNVKGKVFDSREVNVENSIDQFFYEENGKYYMIWGSFRGIYIMELNVDNDLNITPQLDKKTKIAGDAFEGINLWKRDGYYYLFGSTGTCCEGAKSTYKTVVGRSTNLFGPYVNRDGKNMLDNNYEVVIKGNDKFVGTGHNSILVEDDEKDTWIIYHAYQLNNIDAHRVGMLDKIHWDEKGWPYVENGVPSNNAYKPIIKK